MAKTSQQDEFRGKLKQTGRRSWRIGRASTRTSPKNAGSAEVEKDPKTFCNAPCHGLGKSSREDRIGEERAEREGGGEKEEGREGEEGREREG